MELVSLLIATLLFTTATVESASVLFKTINNATGTAGGWRFDHEIGTAYSNQVLADASVFIWDTFHQYGEDRKDVSSITLIVDNLTEYVAYASHQEIHMSASYIAGYDGDVSTEITGVIYHEVTHIWQWNGNGTTPSGLIEGIADYVRLKAGYAPRHWVSNGAGDRWDQGYDVTARFLDYCNQFINGEFVAELNRRMKFSYGEELFVELLGKPVGEVWNEYKAHFAQPPAGGS